MAYPLRLQHHDHIYFVTNRCIDEMFLLQANDPRVNMLILACLTRAVKKHGIEMMGFVFMGNHFHMLFRAPRGNLSDFMRDFESWLAIKFRALRGKDKLTLFSERFKKVDILDEETAFDKLVYMLANPCASDLVDEPAQYPGLSSLAYHESGGPVEGDWLDVGRYNRNRKRNKNYDKSACMTHHSFELAPLPQMADWTHEQRREAIMRALKGECERLRRKRGRKKVMGPAKLKRVDPFSRPKSPKVEPCPRALARDQELIDRHTEHCRKVTEAYYKARRLERDPNTRRLARYPAGTMPPGSHVCVPFDPRPPAEHAAAAAIEGPPPQAPDQLIA